MEEITEDVIAEIAREIVADELSYTDFVSEYDVREVVENTINDMLAGGATLATYDEVTDVIGRIEVLEEELKDVNFWKADRLHGHVSITDRVAKLEDAIFNAYKRVEIGKIQNN